MKTEVLIEFSSILDEKERISALLNNCEGRLDDETFSAPLSDEQRTDLQKEDIDSYSQIIALGDEIKEMNKMKSDLAKKHKEVHLILKDGFIKETGTLFIFEDPENENFELHVNKAGIIINRTRKAFQKQIKFLSKAM